MREVAIVGAGVSGLTCGVVFAEEGYRATIFAEETGQRTTSAAAGAIWYPYDAEPADKVIAWSLDTYALLTDLAENPASGVSTIELRCFARAGDIAIPRWAHSLGARPLATNQMAIVVPGAAEDSRVGPNRSFTSGFAIDVPLTDTTTYLDYLANRFTRAGGLINGGIRFEQLEQVNSAYHVILNCSGIGARTLASDAELEPHRGQVAIVPKLDLPYAIVCNDPPLMYAIPRTNDCVFGGTNDISDDREPLAAETAAIVTECARVLGIAPPEQVAARVGLRPFRGSGIRVERARLNDGRTVIHNYGHGGAGFTTSWGCAQEVLQLSNKIAAAG
jgi:D-amino-acid oxidase